MPSPLIEVEEVIARYTSVPFGDTTPLHNAGLDSLTLLRIAVDLAPGEDTEIDASGLVKLRTIKDLKGWLLELSSAGPEPSC